MNIEKYSPLPPTAFGCIKPMTSFFHSESFKLIFPQSSFARCMERVRAASVVLEITRLAVNPGLPRV